VRISLEPVGGPRCREGVRGLLILGLLLASACAAATQAGPAAAPSSGAPSPTVAVAKLLGKPLQIPTVAPGVACPTTPIFDGQVGVARPRGGPWFFIGGPDPKGGYPWNKTVYVSVGRRGPVLLRGARLDGPGALEFSGEAADPREVGETLNSTGGVTRTFFKSAVEVGTLQQDNEWGDAFYLYPTTPGCYALQADGDGFESVIVFEATQ
jgi:hypothetical protein